MKPNQFYSLQYGYNILEVKAPYKKKSGYIKIALPNSFTEDLLKQLCSNKNEPFSNLVLSWYDNRVQENQLEKEEE